MFRYILALATGSERDVPVWHAACSLARQRGGHVVFLHVRPDPRRVVVSMATAGMDGDAGLGAYVEALEKEAAARQDRAGRAVEAFCAATGIALSGTATATGPTAAWRVETGDVLECVTRFARVADLLVLGRARDDDAAAMDVLDTALTETGRPLLIAPAEPPRQFGQVVAIAWKDTAEAASAVTAALPLLEAARRVVILSVTEQASADQDACERLRQALIWHNLATTVQHLAPEGQEPVARLLQGAGDIGADLLVMGGYGHSRMREMVFGGFTRHVLRTAALPVLMAH